MFVVAKVGLEQITFYFAQSHSVAYGLFAVILAIFTGWLAGVIFRRD
nr:MULTISPECIES: TIGR02186 family protein [unclassified Labrenzia]